MPPFPEEEEKEAGNGLSQEIRISCLKRASTAGVRPTSEPPFSLLCSNLKGTPRPPGPDSLPRSEHQPGLPGCFRSHPGDRRGSRRDLASNPSCTPFSSRPPWPSPSHSRSLLFLTWRAGTTGEDSHTLRSIHPSCAL